MTAAAEEATHRCPAKRCTRQVPDHLLMCGQHWRMVPGPPAGRERGLARRRRALLHRAVGRAGGRRRVVNERLGKDTTRCLT